MDKIQRTFIPGDEWIYFKIYCGPKTAEVILNEAIKPTVDFLMENGISDKWFFIRYGDPKNHIRLRFHYTNPEHTGLIINTLNSNLKFFIENSLVWKVMCDTYNREIERYGDKTIELSESLFCLDSSATLSFLEMIEGDEGEQVRWLFSIVSIDYLLNDFGLSIQEKKDLMFLLKEGFSQEFNMNKESKAQLGTKFRDEKKKITAFYEEQNNPESEYTPIFEVLQKRSIGLSIIAKEIKENLKNNEPFIELNNLLGSYIHMLNNRVFKSKQRMQEMVIYFYLDKYYEALLYSIQGNKKKEK